MPSYLYAIIGIAIIFVCTALGASFVFVFKKKNISPLMNRIFIGFAAGVMFSASFFSLIKPALETEISYMPIWIVVSISVILGAGFLWLIDKIVPHFHVSENEDEGLPSRQLSKTSKMFLGI